MIVRTFGKSHVPGTFYFSFFQNSRDGFELVLFWCVCGVLCTRFILSINIAHAIRPCLWFINLEMQALVVWFVVCFFNGYGSCSRDRQSWLGASDGFSFLVFCFFPRKKGVVVVECTRSRF